MIKLTNILSEIQIQAPKIDRPDLFLLWRRSNHKADLYPFLKEKLKGIDTISMASVEDWLWDPKTKEPDLYQFKKELEKYDI